MSFGPATTGKGTGRGGVMYCWICDRQVFEFALYGVPRRSGKCPHCGAKPRSRVLSWFLREILAPGLAADAEILEVGPSRFSVETLLETRPLGRRPWTLIDRRVTRAHRRVRKPHRFVRMDITRMGFRPRSFDLILCNNVLPYVREDRQALAEIARCLKIDGLAMINTQTGPGSTLPVSDYRRLHPELGDDFFAENGDQWVYGQDFFARVISAGLGYRVAHLFEDQSADFLGKNGLKAANECILAFSDPAALERCRHPQLRLAE